VRFVTWKLGAFAESVELSERAEIIREGDMALFFGISEESRQAARFRARQVLVSGVPLVDPPKRVAWRGRGRQGVHTARATPARR
jgi:hypothetical protein